MKRRRYDPRQVHRAFGLRVRELRTERGWTLESCEERGWKNWRVLQAIESGANCQLTTLVNLANLFGVTLRDLMDFD